MRNIIVDKRMLFWELDVSLACPRISVPDAMKGLVNGKGSILGFAVLNP